MHFCFIYIHSYLEKENHDIESKNNMSIDNNRETQDTISTSPLLHNTSNIYQNIPALVKDLCKKILNPNSPKFPENGKLKRNCYFDSRKCSKNRKKEIILYEGEIRLKGKSYMDGKKKRVWKEIKVDRRKGKCIDGQRIVWNEKEVYGRKEKCMKGKGSVLKERRDVY